MQLKSILKTPLHLILSFIALSTFFSILIAILAGLTTPGGEQLPLTTIGIMMPIIVYGVMALAIVTIPFYFGWFKKNWFISVLFMIPGLGSLYGDIFNNDDEGSGTISIETITVDGNEYQKKTIFYDNSNKPRSVSFMLNGYKDSCWTTYNLDGTIISQEIYKKGALVKKAK